MVPVHNCSAVKAAVGDYGIDIYEIAQDSNCLSKRPQGNRFSIAEVIYFVAERDKDKT